MKTYIQQLTSFRFAATIVTISLATDHFYSYTSAETLLTNQQLYFIIIIIWLVALLGDCVHKMVQLKNQICNNDERLTVLRKESDQLRIERNAADKASKYDELTQIPNRKGLKSYIDQLFNQPHYCPISTTTSLMVVDIDHFKQINDTYGHDVGDNILKQLSSLIQSNIRGSDYFARWGGEEFVIITNSKTHNDDLFADKIRTLISNTTFDQDLQITVSIGVADYDSTLTFDNVFKIADNCLYTAKGNGRNNVVFDNMQLCT